MKKLGILGAVLCAVVALFSIAASAASAEPPVWLVEGAALTAEVSAETEGAVLLRTFSGATEILNIECSGIFTGVIGPNGEGKITGLLNLAKEAISTALTVGGLALECNATDTATSLVACKTETIKDLNEDGVWPIHLPWTSKLELMEVGGVIDVLNVLTGTGGEPGWEVGCTNLLGFLTYSQCEAKAGTATTLVENNAGGVPASVLGWFNALTEAERGPCTLEGITADVVSDVSGDTWAISAELVHLATAIDD